MVVLIQSQNFVLSYHRLDTLSVDRRSPLRGMMPSQPVSPIELLGAVRRQDSSAAWRVKMRECLLCRLAE